MSILFNSAQEEKLMADFISDCFIIELENEVKRQTIQIRKRLNVKLPDAIIAASAISNKLQLFTADKGFRKIPGLASFILN